jgi:hypothetical protein
MRAAVETGKSCCSVTALFCGCFQLQRIDRGVRKRGWWIARRIRVGQCFVHHLLTGRCDISIRNATIFRITAYFRDCECLIPPGLKIAFARHIVVHPPFLDSSRSVPGPNKSPSYNTNTSLSDILCRTACGCRGWGGRSETADRCSMLVSFWGVTRNVTSLRSALEQHSSDVKPTYTPCRYG